MCVDSYSVSVPLRVTAVDHSAKSAGGVLHLNMHTPLTQRSRGGLTMLCPGLVWESIRGTSSHATRPETISHSRLSSLSHRRLILTDERNCYARAGLHLQKRKEKSRRELNRRIFSPDSRKRGRSHHHLRQIVYCHISITVDGCYYASHGRI